jgi:hypothetical protein
MHWFLILGFDPSSVWDRFGATDGATPTAKDVFVARHALITDGRSTGYLPRWPRSRSSPFARYRVGIIPLVLTCAAVGIINTLLA